MSGDSSWRAVDRLARHGAERSRTRLSVRPALTLELGRGRHALVLLLRIRERGRAEVLRRVREPRSSSACPLVRHAESRPASSSAASAVRRSRRRRTPAAPAAEHCRPRCRAPPRLRPLRRPRRLHDAVGEPRRRGGARAALALLRDGRTLIERYGGTVEKFIGDAVMAVWGTPIATRGRRRARGACRRSTSSRPCRRSGTRSARLSSAREPASSPERPRSRSAPRARAWSPATSSTPHRASSRPPSPGTVLVGESTRRATEASIVYEDAGAHELKGKDEAGPALARASRRRRAARAPSSRRGSRRRSSVAIASCGSSRSSSTRRPTSGRRSSSRSPGSPASASHASSWEFEKYIDGLADDRLWHRGRCLSYGEGVAYWALAEMVRMRCASPRTRSRPRRARSCAPRSTEHLLDPEERALRRAAARHLLGSRKARPETRRTSSPPGASSSSGSPRPRPTVLVFEDMQWADSGLLDFLEYLLEWSRAHPLFVLVLARPELADKRPAWGGGKRSFASLYLEPLSPQAMDELLDGLVPGLPEDVRAGVLARAEGVPLYAVETVRMLLDRGLLVREGNALPADRADRRARGAGDAARAHRRSTRRAVDGGAAPRPGRSGAREDVHKAGLGVAHRARRDRPRAASRSARAQGGPRRSRQTPALPSAASTPSCRTSSATSPTRRCRSESARPNTSAPRSSSSPCRAPTKRRSSRWSRRTTSTPGTPPRRRGCRRHPLPSTRDARARRRASGVAGCQRRGATRIRARDRAHRRDPLVQADLHERAGLMAFTGARPEEAGTHFEAAIALFDQAGETHARARVEARLAQIMWDRGRLEEGLERMDRSYQELSQEEPDRRSRRRSQHNSDGSSSSPVATTSRWSASSPRSGLPRAWRSRRRSRRRSIPRRSCSSRTGGKLEGLALLRYALEVALEHDKPSAALRAYFNLADTLAPGRPLRGGRDDGSRRPRVRTARRQPLPGAPLPRPELRALRPGSSGMRCSRWLPQLPEELEAAGRRIGVCGEHLRHRQRPPGQRVDEASGWSPARRFRDLRSTHRSAPRHAMRPSPRSPRARRCERGASCREIALDTSDEMGLSRRSTSRSRSSRRSRLHSSSRDTATRRGACSPSSTSLPAGSRPQFLQAQALRFRARLVGLDG